MGFISFFEIIGTLAFAISGALVAIERELDYYGIAILALTTAVGGGIIRDVLIGRIPPAALVNPFFLILSLIGAVAVIIFYRQIDRLAPVLPLFDAIGLAAFTAIGADIAVMSGYGQPFLVISLATLTGTGGGIMRDLFAREIPFVFRKEVYATASVLGAAVYLVVQRVFHSGLALYFCFLFTFLVRIVSIRKNINLKRVKIAK